MDIELSCGDKSLKLAGLHNLQRHWIEAFMNWLKQESPGDDFVDQLAKIVSSLHIDYRLFAGLNHHSPVFDGIKAFVINPSIGMWTAYEASLMLATIRVLEAQFFSDYSYLYDIKVIFQHAFDTCSDVRFS